MVTPTRVSRAEFITTTTQVGSGLIRSAHREDSASAEFFVSFWIVPDGYRLYKAYAGHADFQQWVFEDHGEAWAAYDALLGADRMPDYTVQD